MTIRPDFALTADTTLPDVNFAAMRQVMLHEAEEHDLLVIENSDVRVTLETPYGRISFGAVAAGVSVTVSAAQQDWLFMLKEGLIEHLVPIVPEAVASLRWSDAGRAGGLLPNFHFATVQSVRPIGSSFLRVRVKSRGLSSFRDDAIHFRVVLPPEGIEDVEWPYLAENGSSVWPKGDKALHRPVYTTRWIDHEAGVMDFDVFVHEGGRVTEWAQRVEPGTQVAVVGPGGGGVPDTRRILMYADETALPAVSRILESLPDDAKGHVTVQAIDGADCAYPLTAPGGVSVAWTKAGTAQSLAELALIEHAEFPDYFLWFACEKTDVQTVRAAFKASGGDPKNSYIAAYWTKS